MDYSFEKLKELLKTVVDKQEAIDALDPETTFETIGINSIELISYIVLLEVMYHITFEDEMLLFKNINTLKKIQDIIVSTAESI